MMTSKKGLQQFYIQSMIDDCRQIVEEHSQNTHYKTIVLSHGDKQVFFHLGMTLKIFLSTIDKTVTSTEFANDYLHQPWINVSRLFFEKDKVRIRINTIHRILDACEETNRRDIGRLDDLSFAR